jgi:hypothetical protein
VVRFRRSARRCMGFQIEVPLFQSTRPPGTRQLQPSGAFLPDVPLAFLVCAFGGKADMAIALRNVLSSIYEYTPYRTILGSHSQYSAKQADELAPFHSHPPKLKTMSRVLT